MATFTFHLRSAAAQGAPQATQCADRFHLLKNLGEAVEDLLARHLSALRKRQVEAALEEQTPAWQERRHPRRSRTPEKGPSAYQQERMARYQQMIQLHEQGMTQDAIAQQLGISLNTVRRWLVSGCPESTRGPYVSRLDPYLPFIWKRWAQGCHTIAQIYRELRAQGYRGSYASVHDNIVRRLQFGGRKTPADASPKHPVLAAPRQALFLFLRRPEELRAQEQEAVTTLRQLHPEVDLAYELVQQFARMLRTRTGAFLDAWLAQVESSKLPELQSFASGIEKDKDAVRAGLTWWGSQRHGGRPRDETEIDQKTGIWQGWVSSFAQTGASCCLAARTSRSSLLRETVQKNHSPALGHVHRPGFKWSSSGLTFFGEEEHHDQGRCLPVEIRWKRAVFVGLQFRPLSASFLLQDSKKIIS